MVRSASPLIVCLSALGGLVVAGVLTGCDTTQNAAARLKISNTRTLASREPTRVRELAENVEVVETALLQSDDGTAIAVTLRNTGSEPINDLPLLVGVRTADGKRDYLNDGKDVPYFQAHAPALAGGEEATWVYTAKGEVAGADSAFAEVGKAPSPPVTVASSLPTVDVSGVRASADDPAKVELEVSNDIGFPQYDLNVFVWATKDGRYVAAGKAAAGDLEPDEAEPVTVKLIGDPKDGELHVFAPPTIFQ